MSRIYLDHAATTPLRPEAAEAMRRGFAMWANPSSPHAEGRAARAALEDARARVKAALGWEGELIFTSGASEAANYHLATKTFDFAMSAVEHDALRYHENRYDDCVEVDTSGAVDVNSLGNRVWTAQIEHEKRVPHPFYRKLIGIQQVNSETGNRQDIASLAPLVQEALGLLMVDCAQSAGKFRIPAEADLAIISAHKFGGPIGIGALLVKDFATIVAEGGQERGYRRGTENVPGALGMAAALECCGDPYLDPAVVEPFDDLAQACRDLGGTWLSDRLSDPTPYIRALAMPHIGAAAQVMRFDLAGIAVSQGSACSSGTMKTSHVLRAMRLEPDIADRIIRVSVGWDTTREEVERFCETWLEMARGAAERGT